MKRRDLEKHMRRHGARLGHEGGRHSVWAIGEGEDERIAAVPRHREINTWTARAVCKDLGIPPPKGR